MSRLKFALMAPFIAFVVLFALGVSTIEYRKFQRENATVSLEINSAIDGNFRASVDTETAMLRTVAEAIAANGAYKEAFRRQDRQALLSLTQTLFHTIGRTARITHLYFTDTRRINFLRVHQPERFGDVIDRHTTLAAERMRSPAAGIELGPLGTLTARVVVPWFDGDELLGYVETGAEIDHLFSALRDQFHLSPLVFLPKNRLDRKNWEDGMAMLGRPAAWDEFDDAVLTVRSDLPTDVIRGFLSEGLRESQIGDRQFVWFRIDLPDAQGKTAASVALVLDTTQRHQEILRFGITLASIALGGSCIVIAIFWLILDRVEAELIRARNELAQREALFHALFSRAKVAMLLIDPKDGAIVDANDEAERFYGYDHARLTAMRITAINTLTSAQTAEEMARASAESRNHFYFCHRLASGEIRDVEVHSNAVAVGERTLLFSIIHDVTERRRLEQERKRLVMALEQCPASIVITDPQGNIEYVNPAFTRTTGYDLAEVIGNNPRLLKSGETTDDEYLAMWKGLSAGQIWSGTFHNKRKDATLYWEHANISPVLDGDGRITHYVGIKEDITARRESEEVIRGLNRSLSQVLAAASEVAIIATGKDGTITLFNHGAERMLGYQAEEVVGRQTPHLFHLTEEITARAPALDGFRALVWRAERDGRDLGEWTYVRKNGERLTVSLAITPMRGEDNTITGYLGVAQDITERRRAEQRLRESEERFRSLIEETTDWIWETDENHCFTWFSSSFDTILDVSSTPMIGKRRWDLASENHEIDPARWQDHMEELTAHKRFRDFRYWIRTGKDQAKWISVSGTPRFDEGGHFLGYRGCGSDVTAYANISLRLRTMSKIVEQSPVSVVVTDPKGVITYVNRHFTTVTGFAGDEAVGHNPSLFASGETAPEIYRELWTTIIAGGTWSGELKNKRKDGSLHWEQLVIFPVSNQEGQLAHFVSIKEDVTDRKAAEQRLVAQMQLTEAARWRTDMLLSSAGEGIFGIDQHGRLVFINPAARRMLGLDDETAIIGRNAHEITGHAHADGKRCDDADCPVTQTRTDGIGRRADGDFYRRRDGTLFPVEFSVTAMIEGGAIAGAVVIFHDITERRAAEQALADAVGHIEGQAAELSRINAELEQFAYVASHDLRQPLRMVSSYLGLIEKRMGSQLSEDLKTFFGFATQGAKRMDRLILDLLEYSRTGRNAGPFEPVPLSEVVEDALMNLEVAIGEAGARLTVAEGLPQIVGDRPELVRLFQNLIGNAVKYRAADRVPEVEIGHRTELSQTIIWVRDNGIGMSPDSHDRAFQIFQRLVAKEQYEGTGIGLAICKKIVANHGGRIWIESAEGEGCCFYVAFPSATSRRRE